LSHIDHLQLLAEKKCLPLATLSMARQTPREHLRQPTASQASHSDLHLAGLLEPVPSSKLAEWMNQPPTIARPSQ
jgi:hypothetical protein